VPKVEEDPTAILAVVLGDTRLALARLCTLFAAREGRVSGMDEDAFNEQLESLARFVHNVGVEQELLEEDSDD